MYITNSPSGTVLLFATTLNVGSVPVTLSSTGNSAGGVSSISGIGSTIVGLNGSYGSFKFFSTMVPVPIFFLNFVFTSSPSGEFNVNLT